MKTSSYQINSRRPSQMDGASPRMRRTARRNAPDSAAPAGHIEDQPVWRRDARLRMEVVTVSGRAASIEFRFRLDSVEVWHHEHCSGIFDRSQLRDWMLHPGDLPLIVDEVTFALDLMVDREGRVALTLPDVDAWTLAPAALENLQRSLKD